MARGVGRCLSGLWGTEGDGQHNEKVVDNSELCQDQRDATEEGPGKDGGWYARSEAYNHARGEDPGHHGSSLHPR